MFLPTITQRIRAESRLLPSEINSLKLFPALFGKFIVVLHLDFVGHRRPPSIRRDGLDFCDTIGIVFGCPSGYLSVPIFADANIVGVTTFFGKANLPPFVASFFENLFNELNNKGRIRPYIVVGCFISKRATFVFKVNHKSVILGRKWMGYDRSLFIMVGVIPTKVKGFPLLIEPTTLIVAPHRPVPFLNNGTFA